MSAADAIRGVTLEPLERLSSYPSGL